MKTINLKKIQSGSNLLFPVSKEDEHLMQHLLNSNFVMISDQSLEKAKTIAGAHGWQILVGE